MNIKPELLTINFKSGRREPVGMIVDHASEGDAASVRSWFNNPAAQVSSHYFVLKNGDVVQFVGDDDEAWHAGRVDHPVAPLVLERPGVNPNRYSIGIEHENNGNESLTAAQFSATVELHRYLSAKHAIPIDARHVVGHHAVYSLKTCPGKIDVGAIIKAANSTAAAAPAAPLVVWSDFYADWLIVTRVVSDDEWYYWRLRDLASPIGTRAQTPLSQMARP